MSAERKDIRFFSTKAEEMDFYRAGAEQRLAATVKAFSQWAGERDRKNLELLEVGRMPENRMVSAMAPFLSSRLSIIEVPEVLWPGAAYASRLETVEESIACRPFAVSTVRVNVEKDPLPWPDSTFDVVLFCEVLEHLLYDPVYALTELGRVLKPGGCLVLTTPNVLCWMNIAVLLANRNPRDLYSGYGPYGRHAREYSMPELRGLLGALGYTPVVALSTFDPPLANAVAKKMVFRLGDLLTRIPLNAFRQKNGNTLVMLAEKHAEIKPVYPRWLFRSRFGNEFPCQGSA